MQSDQPCYAWTLCNITFLLSNDLYCQQERRERERSRARGRREEMKIQFENGELKSKAATLMYKCWFTYPFVLHDVKHIGIIWRWLSMCGCWLLLFSHRAIKLIHSSSYNMILRSIPWCFSQFKERECLCVCVRESVCC